MEKIVIFDTGIQGATKNKIFDRDFAYSISHTLLPTVYLHDEARKQELTFITPDLFLENPKAFKGKSIFLISHLISKDIEKLIQLGVEPLLITCQESPFIATRFYIYLNKYSNLFKYSMLFTGMKKRVGKKTIFIPMYFPQFYSNKNHAPVNFSEKKFLTYITSNKEIKSTLKVLVLKALYGLNIAIIYPLRKKIIHFFSNRSDFDLYGKGWGLEKEDFIKKVYRGEVEEKEKKLREYKFALCLENSIFPGYITEKIFDCFFAGTIPIYLGAPDVANYIPKNTFIDINDFNNLSSLEKYLDSIDEILYDKYIKNIRDFLHSDEYKKFSHQQFAKTIIYLIQNS